MARALPSPETAYHVWLAAWGVAGLALLYRRRAALRFVGDGRTGWTADRETLAAYFAIYAGAWLALGGLAGALARELGELLPDEPGFRTALTLFFSPLFLAVLLLGLRRFLREFSPGRPHRVKPPGAFGFTPSGVLHGFAGAMLLAYGGALAWGGVLLLLKKIGVGDFREPQDIVRILAGAHDPRVLIPFALGAVVAAPVSEELFYRGGLFAALRGRMSPRAACAISGMIFALMHFNVAAFLPLALLGAWLAKLYDDTADLRVPILVHALFNLNTVLWALLAPGAIQPS